MERTTLTKNKEGYGYKYTELAEIHRYLEENDMRYYQTIETNEVNGCDYVMTYRYINGEWEKEAKRGCRVVEATLQGIKNPAQQQGSALTYARRYSLLMAFGLATEDDDAESLSVKMINTVEDARNYVLTFGKHKDKKLSEVPKNYTDWLLENDKTDETIKEAIKMLYESEGIKILTDEEKAEKMQLMAELNELFIDTEIEREKLYNHYEVSNSAEMTIEQLKDAIEKLRKKVA